MTAISEALAIAFQHHQAGRRQEAETIYRRILEIDPEQPDALHLLGLLAHQQGDYGAAIELIGRAIRSKSDASAFHNNLGEALRAAGKTSQAAASYRRALALQPDFAEAHNNLGNALQEQGDFDAAIVRYRRALDLKPDYALALYNLASTLREARNWDEAIDCLRRALAIKPDFVEAHGMQAEILVELGRLPAAEAAFRRAIELQPRFSPAHVGLAMLLRGGLPDADLAALEKLRADARLDVRACANLSFALAHALDGRGDYRGAAELLREANAARLRLAPDRYDPIAHEQFVSGLTRAFDAGFFARLAGAGLDTRQPVFIFGLPRSGTTLVEQILASHSQVCGAGELGLAHDSFEALPAAIGRDPRGPAVGRYAPGSDPLDAAGHLGRPALERLAERHLDRLRSLAAPGARRIVDKMPENYFYLGLLAALFPRATFIHCRRDLRDVAVSCWMTDFKAVRWANDPEHIAAHFRQYRRLMDHWRAVLPAPIVEADYEETVDNLEDVARRLVAACGLEWEPACLEFHRTARPIRTSSSVQVRQPVYRSAIGRWRNYEPALAALLAQAPPQAGP